MRIFAIINLIVGLLVGTAAHADAMRCGSRLITTGDTRAMVREFCGEPADIVTRTILQRPNFMLHGQTYFLNEGYVEVPVEVWTYNLGPNRLMRRVSFIDGNVDSIETLGYGYHEKRDN
ncbi:MAG TPA: DUF2845 domain-containing protein [Steroidobacteraceae bacterium]|nr:DUF2845 domain-containing protein [Steroidobacteraceae bacterium]